MKHVLLSSAAPPNAVSAIAALDLQMVRSRLLGEGWDQGRTDAALLGYRSFLQTVAGGARIEPEPDVDRIWHEHILHTKEYACDCDRIFGAFLHHEPAAAGAQLCVPSIEAKRLCVPSIQRALCVPSIEASALPN